MDAERFIKLMMMTTSDKDYEALVAMRKANAMLLADNLNWEEFIRGMAAAQAEKAPGAQAPPPPRSPNASLLEPQSPELDAAFDRLFATVNVDAPFYKFISDVHDFYQKNGGLTVKQAEAIRRSAERARR